MTSSLKAVLTSTAVFCAVACSTGPSAGNVPLIESSGRSTGSATSGTVSTGAGSGTIAAGSGTTSGNATGASTGTATSGSASGIAGTGASTGTGSGTASGGTGSASGSASGAASGSASGAASGSASGASGTTTTALSFALDVYSDLGLCTTCLPCHAPPGLSGKLDLSTPDNAYASLLGDAGAGAPAAGPSCGGKTPAFTRVVPGNPAASLLYLKLNAKTTDAGAPCGSPMPKTGNALTPTDMSVISQWITGGAKP